LDLQSEKREETRKTKGGGQVADPKYRVSQQGQSGELSAQKERRRSSGSGGGAGVRGKKGQMQHEDQESQEKRRWLGAHKGVLEA
jgi:hypothetical protein